MPKSCDAGANGVGAAAYVASKRRSNAFPVRHCGSVVARIHISGSSVLHRSLQQTLVHPVSNALLQSSWTQADGDQGPAAQTGPPDDQPTSSSVTEDLSALMDLDPSANSISDFEASLFDFSWTTNAPAASSAPATEPFPPSLAAADAPASNLGPFNGNTGSGFPCSSPVQTSASQPSNARGRPSATNQRDLWIRKLSYINIELYQHYVAASPSANVSLPTTDSLSRPGYFSSASFSATTATAADHWNIDQTFVVTLQFLEALEDMAASTSPHANYHTNRLDNSTVLLVFSCYLHLLEIYAALFRDLAASPSSSSSSSPSSSSHRAPSPPPAPRSPSRSSPTSSSPNLALPRLCLGNFVIGPESPLHGSMVVHLAELLLARTHDAVGCVGGGGDGGGGRPASSSSSSASSPNQRRIGRHRADSAGFDDGERGGEGEDGQDGDDGSTRRRASQQMQGHKAGGVVRRTVVSASASENGRRKPSLSDEGVWVRVGMTGDIPGVTVRAVREKEREVRRFLERVRSS